MIELEQSLAHIRTPLYRFNEVLDGKVHDRLNSWNTASFSDLRGQRDLSKYRYEVPLAWSLAEVFSNSRDVLVEWGIGERAYGPWEGEPPSHAIVAIEPSKEAVAYGRQSGMIPPEMKVIYKNAPPYTELSTKTVAGVYGITSFHVLSEAEFQPVVNDFNRMCMPGGIICHLQELTPTLDYVRLMSRSRWERIEVYVKEKYELNNWSKRKILKDGGILSDINRISASRVAHDVHWGMRYTEGQFRIERPQQRSHSIFPEGVWEKTPEVIEALADIGLHRIQTPIFHRKRAVYQMTQMIKEEMLNTSVGGLRGVLSVMDRLGAYLETCSLSEVERHGIAPWVNAYMSSMSTLAHDLFEGYLVTMFSDAGFTVRADRPILQIIYPDEGSPFSHLRETCIDGVMMGEAIAEKQGYQLIGIRRIIAG